MEERNIALRLSYTGSAYHGWQVQKNAVSVAEKYAENRISTTMIAVYIIINVGSICVSFFSCYVLFLSWRLRDIRESVLISAETQKSTSARSEFAQICRRFIANMGSGT